MITNGGFEYFENDEHSITFKEFILNFIHVLSNEQDIDSETFFHSMYFSPTQKPMNAWRWKFSAMQKAIKTKLSSEVNVAEFRIISTKDIILYNSTSELQCVQNIPLLFSDKIKHSIKITCKWKDQGYGNRKGRMFVIRNKKVTTSLQHDDLSGTGEIIYASPIVKHYDSILKTEFTPMSNSSAVNNDTYSIWCHVGQREGHTLDIKNLSIRYLVHEESMKIPCMLHQILIRNMHSNEGIFFRLLLKETIILFCKNSCYYAKLMESSEQQKSLLNNRLFQYLSKMDLIGFSDADVKIFDKFVA